MGSIFAATHQRMTEGKKPSRADAVTHSIIAIDAGRARLLSDCDHHMSDRIDARRKGRSWIVSCNRPCQHPSVCIYRRGLEPS